MKRYQILIFIFGIVAALGLVSVVFPEEGLALGQMQLRFASIEEVMGKDEAEEPRLSPEDLIQLRKKAVMEAEQDAFEDFFLNDPARFYLPQGNLEFFDTLFMALEGADTAAVRIVHYGDSQIEEDRITAVIRDSLQKRFGGDGQGAMPARKHFTSSIGTAADAELDRYMVFANKADDSRYGPYGDFVRLDTTLTLSYYQVRKKDKGQALFNKVTVLAGNVGAGGLSVSCRGITKRFAEGDNYAKAVFELPDSSSRVSLTLSGNADIYGVLMDEQTGVRMDNVPMRGCSGLIFTSMNSAQLRRFYNEENVRLIMLQFGGNSVPYTKTSKAISSYCTSLRRQIAHVQKLAPDAKILFIGPSDMSTSIKGKRQTYPILPEMIDSLKSAVTSSGAAYWDIYGAMGGENSMVDWVNAKPSLAGSDYVHFTPRGSVRIGEMFYDSFRLYYDYYLWRKNNEE